VDVGASTGGFTDCLLQRGATRVYAVDVGWGQLHPKLRNDPRVVCRERTNARHLTPDDFEEPIDLVVCDASFIGIGKLIGAIASFLRPGGDLVTLVKPQFEVGKAVASKHKGVIPEGAAREGAIADAVATIEAAGFSIEARADSALRGPKGNLEHLVWARRSGSDEEDPP
jgi:23S rRNA (cytidine1920-2'-O)/16S rRNA (cytidine1409-2'-O)-methyltransferase